MRLHATEAQLFVSVIPAIANKLPHSPMQTLAQKRFRFGPARLPAIHTGLLTQPVFKPAV